VSHVPSRNFVVIPKPPEVVVDPGPLDVVVDPELERDNQQILGDVHVNVVVNEYTPSTVPP
jgi:hypothetical protein